MEIQAEFVEETPLERAIALAGSVSRLARAVGVKPQAVTAWKNKRRVPPLRVLAVEKATGIPCHELRPDLYPKPYRGR